MTGAEALHWVQRLAAISLPTLAIAVAAAALRRRLPKTIERWLAAATLGGAWVVVSSEALSLLGRLDRAGVLTAWGLFAGAAAWAWKRRGPVDHVERRWPADLGVADWLAIAVATAFGVVLLYLAVATPPNGQDVLTYHLARVVRWMDHHSLAHYPTRDVRALEFPAFSSLAMLHALVLWGSDRFVQTISWFAAIGGATASAALAGRLGLSRRGQWIAAIFFFTIPVVLAEAPTCYNDVILAFWLLVAALGLVSAFRPAAARPDRGYLLWAGTAAGLAVATKSTAPIYVAGLLVVALVYGRRRDGWRGLGAGLRAAAWIALPILLLNLAHEWRNYRALGAPVSKPARNAVLVAELRPGLVFSNLLRALSRHADTVGMSRLVPAVERGVRRVHAWVGVDPDDRRASVGGAPYRIPRSDRGSYGSGWHFLAVAGALGALALARTGVGHRAGNTDAEDARRWMMTLAAVSLGCAAALFGVLRWQAFALRFGLPSLALLAPLVAWFLDGSSKTRRLAGAALCSALLLAAAPILWRHPFHPLTGPASIRRADVGTQLFYSEEWLHASVVDFTSRLRASSCRSLGLSRGVLLEYAFWRLLNGPLRPTDRVSIRYFGSHPTLRLAPDAPATLATADEVCAVVSITSANGLTVNKAPWLESGS